MPFIKKYDDIINKKTVYQLEIRFSEQASVNLNPLDKALMNDIENGPASNTPVADVLLGLETLTRRIEEQGKNE